MDKEDILEFIKTNPDNFSIQMKRHYRELYDTIDKMYDFQKFGEKLYHYIYGDHVGKCEECGKQCGFGGFHKGYRKRCSYFCLNNPKKLSPIVKICPTCRKEFETDKRHNRVTCSTECQFEYVKSPEMIKRTHENTIKSIYKKYGVSSPGQIPNHGKKLKRTKLKRYGDSGYVNPDKAKETKLKKYGNKNYNNQDKCKETCVSKYGVNNAFKLSDQSRGRRISNFQRRIYSDTLIQNPDALLEETLSSGHSVDIYIPSKKKIIECYGDYWHCNPKKYSPDYYNKSMKCTAQEKWNKDKERIDQLTSSGYDVEVRWECD